MANIMVSIIRLCFLDGKSEYTKALLRIRPKWPWAKPPEEKWVSELPYKMEKEQLHAVFHIGTPGVESTSTKVNIFLKYILVLLCSLQSQVSHYLEQH